MANLNSSLLRMNIGKLKTVKAAALELAESKLYSAKEDFILDFENHEVTKEIEAGEGSENLSRTLGGYGNLFSFIGFNSGSNPTEIVKKLIKKIRLINKSYKRSKSDGSVLSFNVSIPSVSEFEKNTPMPWASGRSWLIGIERGISGLGFFVFKKGFGRSEGGIESENKIRQNKYTPVSYFTRMYNNFIKKIKT